MQTPFQNLKVQVVRRSSSPVNDVKPKVKSDGFHKLSVKIANKLGSSTAFYLAVIVILAWVVSGPLFNFSDTWQLVINTGTTIITFLMVFVIQNTQNRDGKAMQLKLDELISKTTGARNEFVDVEDLSDAEIDVLQEQFRKIHQKIQDKKNK